MTNIYILQLINNKYYIGKTNNPQKRLLNHFQRQGSAWTKKYKPIRIEKVINNADDFDEDKWTIKYMKLYGIENVRGGSFCSIQLSESNKQTLQQMITGSGDCCYKCGQRGHFIQKCPFLEQGEEYTENDFTDEEEEYTENDFTDEEEEEEEEYESWCCDFCNKEFDSFQRCTFHENRQCEVAASGPSSNAAVNIPYSRIATQRDIEEAAQARRASRKVQREWRQKHGIKFTDPNVSYAKKQQQAVRHAQRKAQREWRQKHGIKFTTPSRQCP